MDQLFGCSGGNGHPKYTQNPAKAGILFNALFFPWNGKGDPVVM